MMHGHKNIKLFSDFSKDKVYVASNNRKISK